MEIFAFKGGGVRRLMANAIKNFHFFEYLPFEQAHLISTTNIVYLTTFIFELEVSRKMFDPKFGQS